MDEDGTVRDHRSPAEAVAFLRARDERAMRKNEQSTATLIEWRNVPAGFEVPA